MEDVSVVSGGLDLMFAILGPLAVLFFGGAPQTLPLATIILVGLAL
jgi:hypothetical protein